LIFRRKRESTPNVEHLLKQGDALQVIIKADAHGHDVEMIADLSGSASRTSDNRRGRAVRSGALAALFGYFGVRGLFSDPGLIMEAVWFGLTARFGLRAARLSSAGADLDDLQRKVANALNRVCDEAEFGVDPD
jgi:hypothetical protein